MYSSEVLSWRVLTNMSHNIVIDNLEDEFVMSASYSHKYILYIDRGENQRHQRIKHAGLLTNQQPLEEKVHHIPVFNHM